MVGSLTHSGQRGSVRIARSRRVGPAMPLPRSTARQSAPQESPRARAIWAWDSPSDARAALGSMGEGMSGNFEPAEDCCAGIDALRCGEPTMAPAGARRALRRRDHFPRQIGAQEGEAVDERHAGRGLFAGSPGMQPRVERSDDVKQLPCSISRRSVSDFQHRLSPSVAGHRALTRENIGYWPLCVYMSFGIGQAHERRREGRRRP